MKIYIGFLILTFIIGIFFQGTPIRLKALAVAGMCVLVSIAYFVFRMV